MKSTLSHSLESILTFAIVKTYRKIRSIYSKFLCEDTVIFVCLFLLFHANVTFKQCDFEEVHKGPPYFFNPVCTTVLIILITM